MEAEAQPGALVQQLGIPSQRIICRFRVSRRRRHCQDLESSTSSSSTNGSYWLPPDGKEGVVTIISLWHARSYITRDHIVSHVSYSQSIIFTLLLSWHHTNQVSYANCYLAMERKKWQGRLESRMVCGWLSDWLTEWLVDLRMGGT